MNADTCKDFLNALELYHDRKFTGMARDTYWNTLRGYSDERIVLALQASYGKFQPGKVPSINDIKTLLADIRETNQAKEKCAEMANRYPISRPRRIKTPMGRESFKLLNRILAGRWHQGHEEDPEGISGRQCVEEMLKMEEKHPGIGWKKGAEELREWLDRKEKREAEQIEIMMQADLKAASELQSQKKGLHEKQKEADKEGQQAKKRGLQDDPKGKKESPGKNPLAIFGIGI